MNIIKKNKTIEEFDESKIIKAITKSANRINKVFSSSKEIELIDLIKTKLSNITDITVEDIHKIVESSLREIDIDVAKSYMDYRNYKTDMNFNVLNDIERQVKHILDNDDNENSNSNLRYNSTKRTIIAKTFSKEIFQKMELDQETIQCLKDGYFYLHDLSDLIIRQFNCLLVKTDAILDGGFTNENIYNPEPKNVISCLGHITGIIANISGNSYGGTTIPQIDKVVAKYYEKSIIRYEKKYKQLKVKEYKTEAVKSAYKDMKQSFQALENRLNTEGSSRGSYPFTTFSFGKVSNDYEKDVCKAILEVRMEGHGKKGFKQSVVFPKLVFDYHEDLHGEKMKYEDLFNLSLLCSSKCMYPDYIGDFYHRHGKTISPMGCRAYLSDWFDEKGEVQFEGRVNLGAITLNLPMIAQRSKIEELNFFVILEEYLEIIRKNLIKRVDYVGKARADSNPMCFMEGGVIGGNLKAHELIAPLLKNATISFGISALNETQIIMNGKSLKESNEFAMKIMEFINDKVNIFKEEDRIMYALYNTPAESYSSTARNQFVEKYGVIKGVSDKSYFTNSNHLWVGEDVNPMEKQDKEIELFKKSMGGHIGYVRVNNPTNLEGLKAIVLRGIKMGFYQGVNFPACVCEECGHKGHDFGDTCPKCGSNKLNVQDRITGYLGYTKRNGSSTINDGMLANINDRKSM